MFTYVPRGAAIERLARGASSGRPIRVNQGYRDLVEAAFAAIGGLGDYLASTPEPAYPAERLNVRIVPDHGQNLR